MIGTDNLPDRPPIIRVFPVIPTLVRMLVLLQTDTGRHRQTRADPLDRRRKTTTQPARYTLHDCVVPRGAGVSNPTKAMAKRSAAAAASRLLPARRSSGCLRLMLRLALLYVAVVVAGGNIEEFEGTLMFLHVWKCGGTSLRKLVCSWAEAEGLACATVAGCHSLSLEVGCYGFSWVVFHGGLMNVQLKAGSKSSVVVVVPVRRKALFERFGDLFVCMLVGQTASVA